VRGCPKLAIVGWAPLLLCLPGPLPAQGPPAGMASLQGALPDSGSRIYTIHLPDSELPGNLETYVTYSSARASNVRVPPATSAGDWEVTVGFDAARCGIYCEYRRKRDPFGRTSLIHPLLPPITAIQFYTGYASKPTIVTIDPSGLSLPAASGNVPLIQERLYLAGRKLLTTLFRAIGSCWEPASPQTQLLSFAGKWETVFSASVPLRI